MMDTTELVPSVSLDNLLAQRDAIVERIQQAAARLHEVEELGAVAFPSARYAYAVPSLECRRMNTRFPHHVSDFIKSVDATAWDHLLSVSGLRTFMDTETRKKWDESIEKRNVPELTRENIHATFRTLYEQRSVMFEVGLVNVFRALSWDYKTNSPRKFGKRLILRSLVDAWGHGTKRWVTGPRYETCNQVDDLVRVLSVLDGKPEPDSRQGAYQTLREVKWPSSGVATLHGLVSLRGFKNGNGHLTFLRLDLVDKANQILAKHYANILPPAEE